MEAFKKNVKYDVMRLFSLNILFLFSSCITSCFLIKKHFAALYSFSPDTILYKKQPSNGLFLNDRTGHRGLLSKI